MVASYSGLKKSHVKPLFFRTPIFDDESIASWLIRAAFRQGCSVTTFASYYWEEYRLWTLDVDKGFNFVDETIHEDMAILAETTRERFDFKNLTWLSKGMSSTTGKYRTTPWVLPLFKRNRHALYGYHYCPVCLEEDKIPYMRLLWRYSWYTYCHVHAVKMENRCHSCDALFQPGLLSQELQTINHCHSCHEVVTNDYLGNLLLIPEVFELQKQVMQVLEDKQAVVFGQMVNSVDWFDLIGFFITLTKIAARHADNQYKMFRLFNELGLDTSRVSAFSLKESETGLVFESLPIHERIRYLRYAKMLLDIPLDKWVCACLAVEANQNSFMFNGKKSVLPRAFMPVINQLPLVEEQKREKRQFDKPATLNAVKKSWARLQKKASAWAEYEQHLTRK